MSSRNMEHRLQRRCKKFCESAITVPHRFSSSDRGANTYGRSGLGRHFWEAQRGVRAGEPDVRIDCGGRTYYVELKWPPNKPTPAQMAEGQKILDAEGYWTWVDSVEEFGLALETWGVPLANNWRIQAQHHDAMLEAARLKVPAPKKAARPRKEKPSAAALRKVAQMRAKVMF